jgi:hypothetical protein
LGEDRHEAWRGEGTVCGRLDHPPKSPSISVPRKSLRTRSRLSYFFDPPQTLDFGTIRLGWKRRRQGFAWKLCIALPWRVAKIREEVF